MTIRHSLLLAFLLFSAIFALLTASLVYARSRAALSTEIRLNLETQAQTLNQQISTMIFERLQDAQGWQHLDVLQELKVGDVDKRLARFLHDVTTAYHGTYVALLGVAHGRVVAASDAALIGQRVPAAPAWMTVTYRGDRIDLIRPVPDDPHPVLTLRFQIPDAFGGGSLGELHAQTNWREVEQLLDQAAPEGRDVMLLDRDHRPLALSRRLRARPPAAAGFRLGDANQLHGVLELTGGTLGMSRVLVGYAHVDAYKSLPALGWTIAVLTPEAVAFAPVRALLWSLALPFALLTVVAIGFAITLSGRLARPLLDLSHYTREIGLDLDTRLRTIRGSREIEQLCAAFNRMVEDLRGSRTQLVRASKLAAVGEMAAKLAHEIRTPLGIIRSSAQLVDRQPGLDEAGHEMISFMINECDRMNQLVTGLLESARPREPMYREQDVHEIILEVAVMLTEKIDHRQVTLDLQLAAAPSTLRCDRNQIVQVLLNLLTNALQAVPAGGQLRVSTDGNDRELTVAVDDNGPGIPPAARDEIFEPFVSYRAGGIGLGLSIVREIVSLHRGRLAIGDSPLGGARISFTLPRAATGES